jgi:hypothetical protein
VDENQVSDRRRFVRKVLRVAALGGLTGVGHISNLSIIFLSLSPVISAMTWM